MARRKLYDWYVKMLQICQEKGTVKHWKRIKEVRGGQGQGQGEGEGGDEGEGGGEGELSSGSDR